MMFSITSFATINNFSTQGAVNHLNRSNHFETAKGHLEGQSTFHRFGLNEATGTVFEDVWTVSANMVYLTAAETINVSSSSISDDLGSTGAEIIRIQGLVVDADNDWNTVIETLTLNGTTIVPTVNKFIRINRAWVYQAGSNTANAGKISMVSAISATIQAEITIGDNQTLMSHFTVPSGHTAYIFRGMASVGKGDDAQISFMGKDVLNGNVFRMMQRFPLYQTSFSVVMAIPLRATEKMDLVVKAKSGVGSIVVSGGYDMILVEGH